MSAHAFTVLTFCATRIADADDKDSIGDMAAVGVPVTECGWYFGGIADHLTAAGRQCPRALPAAPPTRDHLGGGWPLAQVDIPADRSDEAVRYSVEWWRAWLLAIPYTGYVIVLAARARGDRAAAIQLLNDTFFRRARIRIDGESLVGRIGVLAPEATPPKLELDLDAHQLLVLKDREMIHDEFRRDHLHEVLFRGEPSSEEFAHVLRPAAPNRYDGATVALRTSVSVVAGLEDHLVSGLQISTAQSVAGSARGRHLRRNAYSGLHAARALAAETGADGDTLVKRRAELSRLSRDLGAAESELTFGVRANGDIGLVLPVAEVTEYHAALATVLGWNQSLETSERLLASLAQTIGSGRDTLAAAERDRDERFQGIVAGTGAALLIPGLVAAFFGANIKGIPGQEDTDGALSLLALMLLTAAITLLLLWTIRRGVPQSLFRLVRSMVRSRAVRSPRTSPDAAEP
jgi:hypothetical protein